MLTNSKTKEKEKTMGLDLAIPSAAQILAKIAELNSEKKKKLDEIRAQYKIETARYRALLKVATINNPPPGFTVGPDEELDIQDGEF